MAQEHINSGISTSDNLVTEVVTIPDMEAMVREFMQKYGQYIPEIPTACIPNAVKVLRLRLMMEELGELANAIHTNHYVEIADALADLLYVTVGTAITYGIPINEVFQEVQRSNMTKAPLDKNSKGGKVDKGNYEPPQIRRILVKAGWVPTSAEDPSIKVE